MARLQEDRDIGTEDLLSSGLIPSCHPSLERTGEDEHMNGGGVHRSTNKTGGRDDKGDSKGSGRHLCYLALSPLESIGAGSRQLCSEFLEAMLANSCQWPHSALLG